MLSVYIQDYRAIRNILAPMLSFMLSTIFHHSARPRASRRTLRPTLIIASPPNPEVVRLVIDHLSHDRPTLTTCSLVAKAWAQSAQSHLFRKLCVSGDGSFFLSAAIPDRFTSRRAEARNVQELTIMSRTPGKHARLHRDAFLSIITRLPKLRDRKSTRLNSSHSGESRMPSSA